MYSCVCAHSEESRKAVVRELGIKGRVDWQLQVSATENSWLSTITSHMQYWGNADVALFMLNCLYGDKKG